MHPTMNAPLRLMCTNSTSGVIGELLAHHPAASTCAVDLVVDTAKATRQRIEAGEAADAVVLSQPMLAELREQGWVRASSLRPFARSRVGVAVRSGFPRPDIATVAALREALLSARAIAHTLEGASGRYIPSLLRQLGIDAALQGRIVTRPGGPIGGVVVDGHADLALQQVPELLAVAGLDYVGLLPEAVQCTFDTACALMCRSTRQEEAARVLDYLCSPAHRERFEAKGLEQRSPGA